MDNERAIHHLRAPTNPASHDTGQQSNGTTFTGLNSRNGPQRSNGRSLSLNRQRNSQQSNPTRSEVGNNASSSRNDTQLPSIPSIRFRSVRNQPARESSDGVSPLANVRNRHEGNPSLSSNNVTAESQSLPLDTGTANVLRRRQTQLRSRPQQAAANSPGASGNPTTAPSQASPKARRNGASPRRSNRRSNGTGSSSNNNTNTSSSYSSTAAAHRPRGSDHNSHSHQHWRPSRFSDDSDEDIALLLMNTPPRVHDSSTDDFVTPPRDFRRLRGYGDFRGIGTEDEPLELLNESDVSGPAESTSPLSLSRDEEIARQLQQEEWERASTPMALSFREPNRLQFLQAMHQALGSDDIPDTTFQAPPPRGRRRQNLPPMPVFSAGPRGPNPLQIPALFELLPPGLMQAILGNGQFQPDDDDYEALLAMGDQIGAVSRGMSQRDINKIPVKKHRRPPSASASGTGASSSSSPSQDNSTQCSICLSEFNIGDSKRILPCQHELHKDCIDQWLKTNATCPICRKDIREGREG